MQMYKATIRPGGQVTHEVPRDNLTAAEVILLRHIHGDDAVLHLGRTKTSTKFKRDAERDRLVAAYGDKPVAAAFGSSFGAGLPEEVPTDWLNNREQKAPEDNPLQ